MIESIAAIAAFAATTRATPSAGRATERRQKRLAWLSSLRAAGPCEEAPNEFVALVQSRARIADALTLAEALRAHDAGEAGGDGAGVPVTAADLAQLIATRAAQSLAAQAHVGAAAVRHFVGAGA